MINPLFPYFSVLLSFDVMVWGKSPGALTEEGRDQVDTVKKGRYSP